MIRRDESTGWLYLTCSIFKITQRLIVWRLCNSAVNSLSWVALGVFLLFFFSSSLSEIPCQCLQTHLLIHLEVELLVVSLIVWRHIYSYILQQVHCVCISLTRPLCLPYIRILPAACSLPELPPLWAYSWTSAPSSCCPSSQLRGEYIHLIPRKLL